MSVTYKIITALGEEVNTLPCTSRDHGMFLVHAREDEIESDLGLEILYSDFWVLDNNA